LFDGGTEYGPLIIDQCDFKLAASATFSIVAVLSMRIINPLNAVPRSSSVQCNPAHVVCFRSDLKPIFPNPARRTRAKTDLFSAADEARIQSGILSVH